jgi:SAM-dependent methyltransferase
MHTCASKWLEPGRDRESTMTFDPLGSHPIQRCQICDSARLRSVLFLGYVPPVNTMLPVDGVPSAEMRFPLELKRCDDCSLVQIGYAVDQRILFPHTYPYLSGTTRILRDNFRELAEQCRDLGLLRGNDPVIDIGANDGTLLQPFKELGFRVLGVEPSQAADVAASRGIAMVKDYFSLAAAKKIAAEHGRARLVTTANVFAHIDGVHDVVDGIKTLLEPGGVFISENHYLLALLETNQYDTIYHEHLRYYGLSSLMRLFAAHGMEIFRVKRIPTHGGSIRVFAAEKGAMAIDASVAAALEAEKRFGLTDGSALGDFRARVMQSKLDLLKLIADLKRGGKRIFGIGAPSRASTLITYVGLDDSVLDCIVEVKGSHKLDKYMPGTRIPVLDEEKLYREQPDYALLLSWHIADELMDNLRKRGYRNQFIIPLPEPRLA